MSGLAAFVEGFCLGVVTVSIFSIALNLKRIANILSRGDNA